jgi:fatty-acid peroxygenase
VVLFDEARDVLCQAACWWAGLPPSDRLPAGMARDLVAMVDGFAAAGPRHWRARQARRRCEAQMCELVRRVRQGQTMAPAGSALDVVSTHRDRGAACSTSASPRSSC